MIIFLPSGTVIHADFQELVNQFITVAIIFSQFFQSFMQHFPYIGKRRVVSDILHFRGIGFQVLHFP